MTNVQPIKAYVDVVATLRGLADDIASGNLEVDGVTIIAGTRIYHCGQVDDGRAAVNAVFDMNVGLALMMRPVTDAWSKL
jgi:hypothetical protein